MGRLSGREKKEDRERETKGREKTEERKIRQ
jgi:hypothetical protein